MPRITVDFSEVQDFDVLPVGEYSAIIAKATLRQVGMEPEKFPYINVEMDVQEVLESKEEVGDVKGRKLWMIMSMSPKALGITKQYLENLEIYADDFNIDAEETDTGDLVVTDPELVGLPVRVKVSHREYEGKMQNQVDGIWALGNASAGSATTKRGAGARKTSTAKKSGPARGGKAFK